MRPPFKRRKALLIVLLLALAAAVPRIPLSHPPVAFAISYGDWTVSSVQVLQDQAITLSGNLTVENGGNLTLNGDVITVASNYDGEYGISVDPGGSMYIYNSTIRAANAIDRFTFIVEGDNFALRNSSLMNSGWCAPSDFIGTDTETCMTLPMPGSHAGPLIETNGSIIDGNVISGNGVGMLITGSHDNITRNQFISNDWFGLGGFKSSFDKIYNNTFQQEPTSYEDHIVVFQNGQNDSFVGNTVTEIGTPLLETNSSLLNGRTDGIRMENSVGTVINDNQISVANVAVFLISSHDNTVKHNALTDGEDALSILGGGVSSQIEDNSMIQTSVRGGATYGIYANLAHNSIIANNTISGDVGDIAIYFDHTSNSSLINNQVSVTSSSSTALLVLLSSKGNSVSGNTFSYANFGLILVGSSNNNLVTRNAFHSSHSVTIEGAAGNVIFLNDLHDIKGEGGGPYDSGHNIWYNGTEGNYWSYYTSQSSNGFGEGDSPYPRSAIPPDGVEPFDLSTPITIDPSPVPNMKPIALPVTGPNHAISVIDNQVSQINSGSFPSSVTIENSTLQLASQGPVSIGSPGGSVTILNSKLVDAGYGFTVGCVGATSCSSITIKNSTLDGAYLADLNANKIIIENTTITDSAGDGAVSFANASSILFTGNTVYGQINGVRVNPQTLTTANVSDNSIKNVVQFAIFVVTSHARSLTVANNTIQTCLTLGVGITANTLVTGNNISMDDYVPLDLGSNNTVFGNTMSDSLDTLGISGDGNVVYQNNFVNDFNPVYVTGSENIIYHNNFVNYSGNPEDAGGSNSWSYQSEGNYWSGYSGKDSNFDGIGDSAYNLDGGADNFPFMQPNGWLTKFYLTVQTNLTVSSSIEINGSSFSTGSNGTGNFRLGYDANYSFTFPQTVKLSNGTVFQFVRWSGGYSGTTRIISLSSNSTIEVFYLKQSQQTTTTGVTSLKSTSSTSPTESSSQSSTASKGGGIPELPYSVAIVAVFLVIIVGAYVFVRRKSGMSNPIT